MRVLNDNLLVKVEETTGPRTSAGGLYLPETSDAGGQVISGKVIEVGPGRSDTSARVPMSVTAGDTIMFPKFNATKVEKDGVVYYVVPETQVLIVL